MELSNEGVVNAAGLKSEAGDQADGDVNLVDTTSRELTPTDVNKIDEQAPTEGGGQAGADQKRVILPGKIIPGSEAPDASDPRWLLFAEWAHNPIAHSLGLGAFTDFDNQESTYIKLANAFLNTRWPRPTWRDKKTGEMRSGKDGLAVSGAVLKYNKPVAEMTDDERKELKIEPPDKPGKFQKNFCNSNVDRVEGLVCFDLDGKPGDQPMPRVRGKLRDERLSASGYTTHSHKAEHEKWRIVFYLKHAIPTGTPEQRAIYSRAYHLIGQALFGAGAYDGSCANPARVIYQPSHDGKSPVASWFEPGMQLDPTPYLERARAEIAEEAAKRRTSNGAKAEDDAYRALFKRVRPVIAKYKDRLDLPGFFGAGVLEKVHIPCPWANEHTDGKDNGEACVVWAPGASETGAAHIFCQHSHCRNAHGEGKQRTVAEFVAKAMASMVPPAGIEALLEYVEWTEEEREARSKRARKRAEWAEFEKLGGDPKALKSAIEALDRGKDTFADDRDRVLRAMATIDDPARLEDAKYALRNKKCLLIGAINEAIKQKRSERAFDCRSTDANADVDDEPAAFTERCRELRKRIEEANEREPTLFIRPEGVPVRVNPRGEKVRVEELDHAAWVHELNKRARTPQALDKDEIADLKGSTEWRLPIFETITYVPVFGADGTLQTTPGYCLATRSYLSPDFEILPLPAAGSITDDDVQGVLRLILEEGARDIPYTDNFEGGDPLPIYSDQLDETGWPLPNYSRGTGARANYLAMIIQPFVRYMIDGPCPAYHISKTVHGEGGTLLTHGPAIIFGGEPLPPQPMAKNPDDFQKALLATLRAGPAFILFDNQNGRVDNGDLAAAQTESKYTARELGVSKNLTCKVVGSFVYTGVGTEFSKELHRRNVPIRIDAGCEDATKRTFKYNFDAFLKTHRRELVRGVHILVMNWIQKGKPKGTRRLASFEAWSEVLGGILQAAGVDGFLENLADYQALANDDGASERGLIEHLAATFGADAFTSADVLDRIADGLHGSVLDPVGLLPDFNGQKQQANKTRLTNYIKESLQGRTWTLKTARGIVRLRPHADRTQSAVSTLDVVLRVGRERSPTSWSFVLKP